MKFPGLLELPRRIPLSLRVALVVSPAIVSAQLLTMKLMRENRPIVALYNGPPPPGQALTVDGNALPPTPPVPSSRLEVPRLPDDAMRQITAEDMRRFRARASGLPDHDVRAGFRMAPPRPPWRALLAIFGVTALLVWIAALWVTRPLARLADAAEALGRDMDHPPLDDNGPPEVRRAARAFNGMQDRLRRFVRGREDALLAMSHDLKTPITRLRLRMELLPEDQRSGVAEDVELLQSRVEHALGYMRGVHRDEPMQVVALDALTSKVVEDHQDLGAHISLQGSARPLRCRPAQFERAIANLVENAVRHAGAAEVEIGEQGDIAWIAVRDRGPGVPDALLPRITEPYFRVEGSRNRDRGGTGLGLAIVKDIIEAHGGALRIVNRPGGGLEVRLELPRR